MSSPPSSSLSVIDSSKSSAKSEKPLPTLDFVGSSHAVKDLFSLPYAVDRPISVVVHNLEGTLLIDADPEHDTVQRSSQQQQQQPASATVKDSEEEDQQTKETRSLVALSSLEPPSEALAIVNSLIESSNRTSTSSTNKNTSAQRLKPASLDISSAEGLVPQADDYVARYIPPVPEPREYLSWKFRNMNLLVASDAVIYRSPETALAVRVEETKELQALVQKHQEMKNSGEFVADREFVAKLESEKPSYADVVAPPAQLPRIEAEEQKSCSETKPSFAAPDFNQVQLQTCMVPHGPVGSLLATEEGGGGGGVVRYGSSGPSSLPVTTVLDHYLDNLMANVPQLALCLQEKGFIQSVKLLKTDQIPSSLLKPSTTDTQTPFEIIEGVSSAEQIFSPEIMEMNASTLLRFLKTQCSKDNATYLLRREAGHTNIQLYDISSIPTQRQQKWNWWLAMMSNRFANRLKSLAANTTDRALRRSFRARERSLLQNTLELLEALADMNDSTHESLIAAIHENLADTFLVQPEDLESEAHGTENPAQPSPATSISSQQPYSTITMDALNKAQDHLVEGIRVLKPILDHDLKRLSKFSRRQKKQPKPGVVVTSIGSDNESESSEDSCADESSRKKEEDLLMEITPVATQLFGLHYKLVSVSLRLAEIHLKNYYSSSAMQTLRTASRRLGDSLYLAQLVAREEKERTKEWLRRLQLQYTWLWEHCGHFARSFAADKLWRERGHTSGEDVVSVLQDADCALREHSEIGCNDPSISDFTNPRDTLSDKSMGLISLRSLSGVVGFRAPCEKKGGEPSWFDDERVEYAENLLRKQRFLQREQRRVLIAACIAYGRSIDSYRSMWAEDGVDTPGNAALLDLLRQRLGDACNETGKVMMNEVRNLLATLPVEKGGPFDEEAALAADPLLCSAEFWFLEGLAVFRDCGDLRNVALLRCNLCQCWKLRANAIFADDSSSKPTDGSTHAEECLQEAANHLQAAHEVLGQRDTDPVTWDMVSGELAATFLVLGVRRRQNLIGSGNMPVILQALRLSPGKERSIVEPMERALGIYQQSGNLHQAAAAHYQLALLYSKIWTCQRDETKTREKLALAFQHYNAAHAFFSQAVRGNEPTFCLLCLDLSNLYSTVAGPECLKKAFLRCLDTVVAFSRELIFEATQDLTKRKEWLEKMDTLASSVEDRVFKILRSLVKLEEGGEQQGQTFKDLYRVGLRAKMTASTDKNDDPIVQRILVVHGILDALTQQWNETTGSTTM